MATDRDIRLARQATHHAAQIVAGLLGRSYRLLVVEWLSVVPELNPYRMACPTSPAADEQCDYCNLGIEPEASPDGEDEHHASPKE